MHVRHLRRGWIGCVRIVDDEREALGAGGRAGPLERRRDIGVVAGVLSRDRSTVLKNGRLDGKRHAFIMHSPA